MEVAETDKGDSEEDDDKDDSPFSTTKMSGTPLNGLRDLNPKMPTRLDFAKTSDFPSLPVFPSVSCSSEPDIPSVGPRLKLNLKRRGEHLGGSPIRKTALAHDQKEEMGIQIGEILDLVRELSITVEKQARETKEISKETIYPGVKTLNFTPNVSMASRLADSVVNAQTSSLAPPVITKLPIRPGASFRNPTFGPQIIIDLKACDIKLNERSSVEN